MVSVKKVHTWKKEQKQINPHYRREVKCEVQQIWKGYCKSLCFFKVWNVSVGIRGNEAL
jgi:hypothetical protein